MMMKFVTVSFLEKLFYVVENKCTPSVIIIIATYQQAYLHIARGFVTQGDSTLTIFFVVVV